MKTIAILGAGTAGTIMAHKLRYRLSKKEWKIVVIDKDECHHYQPGYLFIPFDLYEPKQVLKSKRKLLPKDIDFILSDVELVEPEQNRIRLGENRRIDYDYLIIATGTQIAPQETEGLKGEGWYRNVFDFYTLEGSSALQKYLRNWTGGRLVLNIVEMPIKCPVAPLEFVFFADWFFTKKGIRDKVELIYATPLPGAFTKPKASEVLGEFLNKRNIKVVSEFATGSVDEGRNVLVSYDGREVPYDLLVSVPLNMGNEVIARSDMGDELNYVATEKHSLRSKNHQNIFILGDATDLPSSKAGSVAHFQADLLSENILRRQLPKKKV